MHYFKNVDLTKLYPISESSVRKWIDAARNHRLELQLVEYNDKLYIANTDKNRAQIESLIEANRKYRNTRSYKTVSPDPSFYELYEAKYVRDIILSIKNHREIPLQYSYFDGGVNYWDHYMAQLVKAENPNILTSTIELLASNASTIERLIAGYEKVNVVDIGVGNGLPAKDLLTRLSQLRVLNRYIGVDISPAMTELTERNINSWFGHQVPFEPWLGDISHETFGDLFADEFFKDERPPISLMLLFGGTIGNLRMPDDALRNINNSMSTHDLLIYARKLDTPNARRFFDFNVGDTIQPLSEQERLILDLLNIDKSFYEVEQLYDEQKRARIIRIRFLVSVSIQFEFDDHTYRVHLNKGETLLVWRSLHQNTLEVINQFDRNGFKLLQASLTEDYEYLLTISRIKSDSE